MCEMYHPKLNNVNLSARIANRASRYTHTHSRGTFETVTSNDNCVAGSKFDAKHIQYAFRLLLLCVRGEEEEKE